MPWAGTRRWLLAGAAAVGTGFAGCGEANTPEQTDYEPVTPVEVPENDDDDGVVEGPPVTEPVLSTEYDLYDVFDAALAGDGDDHADDPPEVGRFDVAIDEPKFVDFISPDEAEAFLDPDDVVFGLEIDGEVKAYPQRILVWHEIVNDELAGTNVSVTYCPLTGSALAFERGETSFGLSGKLVNSNLILYDRGTETWWPQLLGAGIVGAHEGDGLVERRLTWTTWGRWRVAHPDTRVLSRDTGYDRDYDSDPYGSYNPLEGYYSVGPPARNVMHENDRFHPKTVMVATRGGGAPAAVRKKTLREEKLVTVEAADTVYTMAYDESLDTAYAYGNPERVEFEHDEGAFLAPEPDENDTGYPRSADELPLEPVNVFDVMWFAWVGFYPETAVVPDSETWNPPA